MACSQNSHTFGPVVTWTKKNTTDWVFFPLSAPMGSAPVKQVRASFEMANSSGAVQSRPALRMSNDGQTWDAPVAIGTATRTSDGTTFGNGFTDVQTTTNAKAFVQFGVEVRNESGTSLEQCLSTLKVDLD